MKPSETEISTKVYLPKHRARTSFETLAETFGTKPYSAFEYYRDKKAREKDE